MNKQIKISNKDLIWNYLGYGWSLGINIILLPIVLHFLQPQELGLWYVFLSIGTFVSLFDFGFAPQMARQITYSFSGASSLQKTGLSTVPVVEEVNYSLFSNLIKTARLIYLLIAGLVLIILLTGGTYYVIYISGELFSWKVLLAWFCYSVACFINLYFSYYNAIFRGLGNFVALSKATVFSKMAQLCVAGIGLYYGQGLLAVSAAYLISGVIFRLLLIRSFNIYRQLIATEKRTDKQNVIENFKIIWHNAWRDGIVMLSRYFTSQSNTIICSLYLGLAETASYALSIQIITIVSSFSTIYYSTNQPELTEANLHRDLKRKRFIFARSWVVFIFAFLFLSIGVIVAGFPLLKILGAKTQMNVWIYLALSIYLFLEANHSLFASYISTGNILPYTFPYLISSILSLILSVIIIKTTSWGIWGLIASPFIVQLAYNNWKWPQYVLRDLHISLKNLFTNGVRGLYKSLKQQYNNI